MEFKLLEKKKDTIKVEIQDADETLIYPLIHELLQDKNLSWTRGTSRAIPNSTNPP